MKIIILGGDGFCGWPTALHLSNAGHDITIIDSLVRRDIDSHLQIQSLTPIWNITDRIKEWHRLTGKTISFYKIDISAEYNNLQSVIETVRPDTIIHMAEQRSAPFSMINSDTKKYTVQNNVVGTTNILNAIVDSKMDIHLVHLGTMGVYGYDTAGIIPEGYLNVTINGVETEIMYPTDPGSIYHLSKSIDALLFYFYNKNNGIRITDLHQGIVWGTQTSETLKSERLINRFDYDGEFGTVLNRFLVQSVVGHPLSVYGSGLQQRAFIHISDSVRSIQIATENPPDKNTKVLIFNQMTEVHSIIDLANKVSTLAKCEVDFIKNPRKEKESNRLTVVNKQLLSRGLLPTMLDDELLHEIHDIVFKFRNRIDLSTIPSRSVW